uniref:HDC19672 n=1 Tax=Drosophila melanogaster TaxID=7227 RepID=Q6II56_DROME|nr:TPA_inf: HDC19672 [Drosophila melanogaster]
MMAMTGAQLSRTEGESEPNGVKVPRNEGPCINLSIGSRVAYHHISKYNRFGSLGTTNVGWLIDRGTWWASIPKPEHQNKKHRFWPALISRALNGSITKLGLRWGSPSNRELQARRVREFNRISTEIELKMPPRIFLGGGPPRKRLTSQSPRSRSRSRSRRHESVAVAMAMAMPTSGHPGNSSTPH